MKRRIMMVAVCILLVCCAVILCSCSSSKTRFFMQGSNEPYKVSPETAVKSILTAVLPEQMQQKVQQGSFSAEGGFSTFTLSDVQIPVQSSGLSVNGGIADGTFAVDISGFEGFDQDVLQLRISESSADLYWTGILDQPVQVPLTEYVPTDLFSAQAETDVKNIFTTFFTSAYQDVYSKISAKDTTVTVDGQDVSAKEITLTMDKENTLKLMSSLFTAIQNSSERTKAILQQILFDNDGILAGTLDQYLANTLATLNEYDAQITWRRVVCEAGIVEDDFLLHSSNPDYCRQVVYKCYNNSGQSLIVTNPDSGESVLDCSFYRSDDGCAGKIEMPAMAFSVDTTRSGDSYTASVDVTISDTVYYLDLLYTFSAEDSNVCGVKISVSDSEEKTEIEGAFTGEFAPETAFPETGVPQDCLVLSNGIAGADVYDQVLTRLQERVPELKEAGFTAIGIASDFSQQESGAVINGTAYSAVPYQFLALQNRDYYQQMASMRWPEKSFEEALNEAVLTGETLRELILERTRENYLQIYCIDQQFQQLGLDLTLVQLSDIATGLKTEYTPEDIAGYCTQLGITESQLRWLYATSFYKQNMLYDYYYGAAGQNRVSAEDAREIFQSDYTGFRYVIQYTAGYDGQSLSEEEISSIQEQMKGYYEQIQSGQLSMEDAIQQYSADYVSQEEMDLYTSQTRESAEEFNQLLLQGCVIDRDGSFETDTVYTYPSDVAEKVFEMQVNELAYLENSLGCWIIQRTDVSDRFEEAASYVSRQEANTRCSELVQSWTQALDVQMNDAVVAQYAPDQLLASQ